MKQKQKLFVHKRKNDKIIDLAFVDALVQIEQRLEKLEEDNKKQKKFLGTLRDKIKFGLILLLIILAIFEFIDWKDVFLTLQLFF